MNKDELYGERKEAWHAVLGGQWMHFVVRKWMTEGYGREGT